MRTPSLVTPRFLLVCVSGACYFFAFSLPFSVLPVWVETELGGTSTEVGLSVGILGLTAAVLRPVIGPIGDRRGRRLLVVAGAAVGAAHLALLAFVDSIPMVVAIRLLGGIGEAAVFVGLASTIQDLTPDERRGEAASYFSLTIYGALAVAPAVGDRLVHATSYDTAWLATGGLALAAGLFGLVSPGAPAARPPAPARYRYLHPAAVRPGIILLLGLTAYTGFLSFAAIHAADVGIARPGTVFTVLAVVVLTLRLLGAQVPDRAGPLRTTIASLAISIVGLLILGVWRKPAGVYVGAAVLGVAQTFFFPALFVLVVDRAPIHERSHAIGSFSMAFDLSFVTGGAFIGVIADVWDRSTAFLAVALVNGVALALSPRILGGVSTTQLAVATAGPRSRR